MLPSARRAGSHRSVSSLAAATAAETVALRRPRPGSRCCGPGSRPRTPPSSPPSRNGPPPGRPRLAGIVAVAVTGSYLCRQLIDAGVQNSEQIGGVVGGSVTRPQHGAERLTGRIRETKQRVETETAFEVRCGAFLVLGVDLHQRRVQVQHHRCGARRRPRTSPHPGPDLPHRPPGPPHSFGVQGVDKGPIPSPSTPPQTSGPGIPKTRCRHRTHHRQRASTWRAPTPCPGHGPAPPGPSNRPPRTGRHRHRSGPRTPPKRVQPTWPTTCEPTLSTATFLVLVAFTSEMPFCSG